jgi:hypothetical protein
VHRGDLVVATQGRSFWILDDLTPLRELAAQTVSGPGRLFTPRDVARGVMGDVLGELDLLRPDPLPFGALINYTLTREARNLRLEVVNAQGRMVRSFASDSAGAAGLGTPRLSAARGFHQVVWDLTYPGPRQPGAAASGGTGPKAPPGQYSVRLTAEGLSETRSVRVTGNPLNPEVSQADYEAQFRLASAVRDTLDAIYRAVETIRNIRDQAGALVERARAGNRELGRVAELRDSLATRLTAIEAELVRPAQVRANPARLDNQYNSLLGFVAGTGGYGPGSAESRPTAGAVERQRDLDIRWGAVRGRLNRALAAELATFNAEAGRLGLGGVIPPAPRP